MDKKQKEEIKDYYKKEKVVKSYDTRRFEGIGGKYINDNEVLPIISILKDLNLEKGLSVLDLGAGKGRLSIPLKKLGCEVYCLDSSQEMVKHLGKDFPKKQILLQSIFDSIETNEKFDVITSLRFFDHFDIKDQRKILKNVLKRLKKGGYIIYASLNKNSLEGFLSKFFSYGRVNFYYSDEEYRRLFKSLGLKIISREGSFFLPRGAFLFLQKIPICTQVFKFLDKFLIGIFGKLGALYVYLVAES